MDGVKTIPNAVPQMTPSVRNSISIEYVNEEETRPMHPKPLPAMMTARCPKRFVKAEASGPFYEKKKILIMNQLVMYIRSTIITCQSTSEERS